MTPRLTVRPARAEDAEALHRIRCEMPFDPPKRDLDGTRAMIAAVLATPQGTPGWQQYVVVADGAVIGDFGINFGHPGPEQAEIGFAFAASVRGQGLASEAAAPLVERLFASGLHRLYAVTDARNLAAQRLLTRLGFRQEAHFVQSWRDGDEWFDEFAYARRADQSGGRQ